MYDIPSFSYLHAYDHRQLALGQFSRLHSPLSTDGDPFPHLSSITLKPVKPLNWPALIYYQDIHPSCIWANNQGLWQAWHSQKAAQGKMDNVLLSEGESSPGWHSHVLAEQCRRRAFCLVFWGGLVGFFFCVCGFFPPQGAEIFHKLGERKELLGKQESCNFPATARLLDKRPEVQGTPIKHYGWSASS